MSQAVAISRCRSYAPEQILPALTEAVESAGGLDVKDKTVLLKPNILSDAPVERAVSTHPEFVRAAIRLCRARGAGRILVGDSPAVHRSSFDGHISGIRNVVEEESAEWVDFREAKTTYKVENPLIESEFSLAEVLEHTDVLISLAKLKTHELMLYTGAMKNLYGLIPGYSKAALHVKYPNRDDFGKMLVDLLKTVQASYALMDAVVGMEGHGPGNGHPRSVGLIGASPSSFALDLVFSELIGYDPVKIPNIKHAFGIIDGIKSRDDIRLKGVPVEEVRPSNYKLIQGSRTGFLPHFLQRIPFIHRLETRMRAKPVFHHDRCILCGECVAICASRALSIKGNGEARQVSIDYRKCIRCYCCHEVCPAEAITIE